jgi:hypothetical protein
MASRRNAMTTVGVVLLLIWAVIEFERCGKK